eukprot:1928648-Rhodomonas_salina.3
MPQAPRFQKAARDCSRHWHAHIIHTILLPLRSSESIFTPAPFRPAVTTVVSESATGTENIQVFSLAQGFSSPPWRGAYYSSNECVPPCEMSSKSSRDSEHNSPDTMSYLSRLRQTIS